MKTLTLATALLVCVLVGGPAKAASNWTQYNDPSQPLFTTDAGFAQARNGNQTSITVVNKPWLQKGMNYWNNLAGWNVFVFTTDTTSQIVAHVDQQCRYCAEPISATTHQPSTWGPYESCNVSIAKDQRANAVVVAHELGHCLGIAHLKASVMNPATSNSGMDPGWAAGDRQVLVTASYAASSVSSSGS